jgi:hypothetical protein
VMSSVMNIKKEIYDPKYNLPQCHACRVSCRWMTARPPSPMCRQSLTSIFDKRVLLAKNHDNNDEEHEESTRKEKVLLSLQPVQHIGGRTPRKVCV